MRAEMQLGESISKQPTYYRVAKRTFDLVSAGIGAVILSPLIPIIAGLIKIDSPGPVLFIQQRLGKDGELFRIYKFRTMKHRAPEYRNPDGSKRVEENDERLTRVGKILRDFSLDELPQLINILRGEMSLVGPRPDTPGAPGMDAEVFLKKRMVKPGLTSLASIRGRNGISWRQRVELESQYVDRASLTFDLYILLKTIPLVLRREGIYSHKP
jgi:lipopolysaccharide/colanic/teichoic acid biosynthesis glycosyltransferase